MVGNISGGGGYGAHGAAGVVPGSAAVVSVSQGGRAGPFLYFPKAHDDRDAAETDHRQNSEVVNIRPQSCLEGKILLDHAIGALTAEDRPGRLAKDLLQSLQAIPRKALLLRKHKDFPLLNQI